MFQHLSRIPIRATWFRDIQAGKKLTYSVFITKKPIGRVNREIEITFRPVVQRSTEAIEAYGEEFAQHVSLLRTSLPSSSTSAGIEDCCLLRYFIALQNSLGFIFWKYDSFALRSSRVTLFRISLYFDKFLLRILILHYVPVIIIACPQGIIYYFTLYGHSWFLLLKSISNPSHSLIFKVSVSAARRKRPQPDPALHHAYACGDLYLIGQDKNGGRAVGHLLIGVH